VDALRLLDLIAGLNKDLDATGKELKRKGTRFCTGAALNPHKMSRNAQIHRLKYKLGAGVDFFQTQPVYDVETVTEISEVIGSLCDTLHREPPKVMIGIIPPKSADFARFMNQKILGISIPNSFIEILERSKDPVKESIQYCADLVQGMIPHAGGFHFMPVGMEKHSADLLDACFNNASGLRRLKII
jgi:5,10-methylenetetrahydrofolate reductase